MNLQQKNYLIDSHCHIHTMDLSEFGEALEQVVSTADKANVKKMLCVSIELEDVPELRSMANRFDNIYISAGPHPNSAVKNEPSSAQLIELSNHPRCIAIGETGLDYYRVQTEQEKDVQRQRFREHIRASKETNKPLIIHTRSAPEDTLSILKQENAQTVGGVLHCFTESLEMAEAALDLGFYISFSGIITFKGAEALRDVVRKVPLERLLVETDSPYLAPVPFRGKQNHPALVSEVAKMVAELKQVTEDTVTLATTENFYQCFKV